MLEMHILTFGGLLTAHAATRISEAIASALDDSYGEADMVLDLADEGDVAERYLPNEGMPKAEHFRPYLLACVAKGVPASFKMWSCCWDDGAHKIEALQYEAIDLALTGRLIIGTHRDTNGDAVPPFAHLFGPDAPSQEYYLLGKGHEPAIWIEPDLDLRSLAREAARLRMLSEWCPPPLQAHADLRAEIAELKLAA